MQVVQDFFFTYVIRFIDIQKTDPNSTARHSKVTVTSQMVTIVTVTMVTKNRLYIVVIL